MRDEVEDSESTVATSERFTTPRLASGERPQNLCHVLKMLQVPSIMAWAKPEKRDTIPISELKVSAVWHVCDRSC